MELQQIDAAPFSFELSLAYDCPGLVLQDLYQDAIRRFQASTHYRSSSAAFKPFKPWNFEWKQKKQKNSEFSRAKFHVVSYSSSSSIQDSWWLPARGYGCRLRKTNRNNLQIAKGGITHTIFGVPLWSRKENLYLKSSAKNRSKKKVWRCSSTAVGSCRGEPTTNPQPSPTSSATALISSLISARKVVSSSLISSPLWPKQESRILGAVLMLLCAPWLWPLCRWVFCILQLIFWNCSWRSVDNTLSLLIARRIAITDLCWFCLGHQRLEHLFKECLH